MNTNNILEKTIELIENNLDNQNLNITFLSKQLYFSSYYLQRLFYSKVGKTIGSYIRERRLTEAGTDIKKGEKVIEVAIKYGYESQESFTRAFKKFHGVNPGVAKKGIILSCLPAINIKKIKKGEIKMDIKIEKENAFTVIVKIKQFNEETSFEDIPKFWDEYYEKGYQDVVPPMLGICFNNSESLEFEYGIGSLKEYCSEVLEGFKEITIPEHLWGKFYTKGKMPKAIQDLWKEVIEWVQNSEYELADNYDFECYSEGDSNSDDYISGIWVPLKLKGE
jgi:AraC family transcriptional regulator